MNTRDDTDHEPSGKFSGRSAGADRRPHKSKQSRPSSPSRPTDQPTGKGLAGAGNPPPEKPEEFGPNWKSLEKFLRDRIDVQNKRQADNVIRWITLGKHEDIETVKRDEHLSQVIEGCLQMKPEQGVAFDQVLEAAANYNATEQKEENSVEEEQ